MPSFQQIYDSAPQPQEDQRLPFRFPPVRKDHILHCSYDWWFPKFKSHCIKSEIISIPQDVLDYLNDDGIIQADNSDAEDEHDEHADEDEIEWATPSANTPSMTPASDITACLSAYPGQDEDQDSSDDEAEINSTPPNKRFPSFHQSLKSAIADLGGAVIPKLNWSAPKDAAFMRGEHSLRCTSPNDVYLLLKSSSFAAHDLGHAFDDCDESVPISPSARSGTQNLTTELPFAPVLVLRSWFDVQPSLEFRCFVKRNMLVGMCQRDGNRYDWLPALRGAIVEKVEGFFEMVLRSRFPDHSYAFDVYIPEDRDAADKLGRVRLIDVNPWAPRTDSLLFEWEELLTMKVPGMLLGTPEPAETNAQESETDSEVTEEEEDGDDDEEADFVPELRLVEAGSHVNLMGTEYSAHKLPREVVDAARTEGGMGEFMGTWRRMIETRCQMGE